MQIRKPVVPPNFFMPFHFFGYRRLRGHQDPTYFAGFNLITQMRILMLSIVWDMWRTCGAPTLPQPPNKGQCHKISMPNLFHPTWAEVFSEKCFDFVELIVLKCRIPYLLSWVKETWELNSAVLNDTTGLRKMLFTNPLVEY